MTLIPFILKSTRSCGCAALCLLCGSLSLPAQTSPAMAKIPRYVIGPPNGADHGICFRELFEHPDDWKQTRAVTDEILYADWPFKQFSDADLTKWFAEMNAWNIPLDLEVGAVKPWGKTGAAAFAHDRKDWDRIIKLGGHIATVAMDEPLICTRRFLHLSDDYSATETANFVALVRQNYPQMRIADIETYPGTSLEDHQKWLTLLQGKLADRHVKGLDFYRLDVNWAAFKAQHGSWAGLMEVEDYCHQVGLPVSIIYWSADYPQVKQKEHPDDSAWYKGIMFEGQGYADAGGKPDQFAVESWVAAPSHSVPETGDYTFTRSALDFYHKFVDPSNLSVPSP
jgi:hypothetical protein